jgi:hypothetical protein
MPLAYYTIKSGVETFTLNFANLMEAYLIMKRCRGYLGPQTFGMYSNLLMDNIDWIPNCDVSHSLVSLVLAECFERGDL